MDTLNGTNTVRRLSGKGKLTGSQTLPPSSAISESSSIKGTPSDIEAWLMSLPEASRVSRSQLQETNAEPTTQGICGRQPQTLFGLSSLDSACLRMCQEYANTCPWSSETCADLGTQFQDPCSLGLTMLVHGISDREYGLLPTPTVTDYHGAKKNGINLKRNHFVRTSQTTGLEYGAKLTDAVMTIGLKLHPDFAEYVMGWPIGWTDLEPLGMDKFQLWQRQHGIF